MFVCLFVVGCFEGFEEAPVQDMEMKTVGQAIMPPDAPRWQPGQAGHTFVAIRSYNSGEFVRIGYDDSNLRLHADTTEVGEWETFLLIELGNGKIRLQGSEEDFIRADGGGGGEMFMAEFAGTGSWLTFTPIDLGNDLWGLGTWDGDHLVRTKNYGDEVYRLQATAHTNTSDSTKFEIFVLEDPPVTNQSFVSIRSSLTDPNSPDPEAPEHLYLSGKFVRKVVEADKYENELGGHQTFHMVEFGDGTASLQAKNGQYIKAISKGGGDVELADADNSNLLYEVVRGLPALGPDQVLLRTEDNYYLNINSDMKLEATATGYETAAIFGLEPLEGQPWPQELEVTIQSVETGQYLNALNGTNGAPQLEDTARRIQGTFLMVEDSDGYASFTRIKSPKQLKVPN